MIKNVFYVAVIASLITACGQQGEAPQPAVQGTAARVLAGAPAGAVVAVVNGETVTEPMLATFAAGRGLDASDPAARARALESLVENILLAQDAHARGLAARPEVQAEIALVGLQQLAGRNLSELRRTLAPSDDEVRAYYDQEASRTGGVELQLQHILFSDEAEARTAHAAVSAPGADFAAAMSEYGAGSAKQAKDLGWANLTQLPPELAAAAQGVADGSVGPQPVHTRFGWHVYKRVASRPYTPPPFEQVRDGARKQLVEQRIREHVAALREKGQVDTPTPAVH